MFFQEMPSHYRGIPGNGATSYSLYKAEQAFSLTQSQLVEERSRIQRQAKSFVHKVGL